MQSKTNASAKKLVLLLSCILLVSLNLKAQELTDDEYMNAYVVVLDSSQNYYKLHKMMTEISTKQRIEIDLMGRSYSKEKNLICLPDDDEDEFYAGGYFPRRYPSENLSLEYLYFYEDEKKVDDKVIALVAMITDDKAEAEKYLTKIKKSAKNSFLINSKIYMGCMH